MTTTDTSLQQLLHEHGQSLTRPRQIVFEALRQHDNLTISELVTACRGRIDRASVYRTVGVFEALGVVQRLQIGWKYKLELSDRFTDHHHHATCNRCGAITPLVEDSSLEKQLIAIANSHGFVHQSHQLEIRGLCAACRGNGAN